MTVVLYLLGISLSLGAIGLAVFLWSLHSGQYDDMEGAANRILFDDEPDLPPPAGRTGSAPPPGTSR
jgi:cbb3-type cytochrome oxidase maturation protein